MKKSCQTNHELASLIISDLINLNVENFCMGSGSRSAPFALAIKNHPLAKSLTHYDERSLGFFALGVAKAQRAPVCIITTSGSAVANLFPAVMEAYMDNVPLLIITCDRPFEDNDRGMNQTCNHDNIFGNYVEYTRSFPPTPHEFDRNAISSTLSYSASTLKTSKLPVHLNVPFSEPLVEETKTLTFSHDITQDLPAKTTLCDDSLDYVCDILSSTEKGLIIVGGHQNEDAAGSIITLSEKLGFPILADPLSNIREKGKLSNCITHFNQIIHHTSKTKTLNPDVILFFGGHIISKNIICWTKSLTDTHQILVTEKKRHFDLTLSINTRIQMDIDDFATSANRKIKRKTPSLFLATWKGHSLTVESSIEDFFEDSESLYEPMSITSLLPVLEDTPFPIFLGNSLPIRYCDNFLFPKKVINKIYSNRGVSGIDGNISTALGICKTLNTPLVTILGDATFLYDTGALSLMKNEQIPLIIVIINNNGGGIFNFLPYNNEKELINENIAPPTNLNIGHIASSFNIPFWKAETAGDYQKMIAHLLSESSGGIIEITSNKEENLKIHETLNEHIKSALSKNLKKERFSYFSLQKKTKSHSFASTDS